MIQLLEDIAQQSESISAPPLIQIPYITSVLLQVLWVTACCREFFFFWFAFYAYTSEVPLSLSGILSPLSACSGDCDVHDGNPSFNIVVTISHLVCRHGVRRS